MYNNFNMDYDFKQQIFQVRLQNGNAKFSIFKKLIEI